MAREYLGLILCAALILGSAAGAVSIDGTPFGRDAGLEAQRAGPTQPQISGDTDGRHAWMTAVHRGLIVRKLANRAKRTVSIELRYHLDAVSVAVDHEGIVSVTRRGRTVAVGSAESIQQVEVLLNGSEAVLVFRAMLSERESISDSKAPGLSLLSAAAFVASLVGDLEAPGLLEPRFAVEKRRRVSRPSRSERCASDYCSESIEAWDDLQSCMDLANHDDGSFDPAYRSVTCNVAWIRQLESAWFEYLECL
jgi:hypothetical protein